MGSDAWARHGGAVLFVLLLLLLKAVPELPRIPSARPSAGAERAPGAGQPALLERRLGADPWAGDLDRQTAALAAGSLEQELLAQVRRGNRTVIVLVAATQPYAEQAERRLRDRVALHHAAAAAGFVPMDAEHLRILHGRTLEGAPFQAAVEVLVPLVGSAQCAASHGAVVVWVGSDIEAGVRLWEKLEAVTALASPVRFSWRMGDGPGSGELRPVPELRGGDANRPQVVIVGPPYSGDLVWLIRAAVAHGRGPLADALWSSDARASRLRFISPTATIPPPQLWHEVRSRTFDAQDADERGQAVSDADRLARWDRASLRVERPTATDDAMLETLATELLARRSMMDTERWRIMVLIEQDTAYGRSMGRLLDRHLFTAAVATGVPVPEVVVLPYLRGLDGESPGGADGARLPSGAASSPTRGGIDAVPSIQVRTDDPSVGESRCDYLRRLADDMVRRVDEEDSDGRIAAVGLLGTDLYDKLMLVQALRPAMPEAVFFTTELDSRMLSRKAQPWMRNMLVASPFPLEDSAVPIPGARPDAAPLLTPPFRDSAQASLYRTLRGLLLEMGSACPATADPCGQRPTARAALETSPQRAPGGGAPPRPDETAGMHPVGLYEVGRTRFVPLVVHPIPRATRPSKDDPQRPASSTTEDRDVAKSFAAEWSTSVLGVTALAIFVCIVAYARVSGTPCGDAPSAGPEVSRRWDPASPALWPYVTRCAGRLGPPAALAGPSLTVLWPFALVHWWRRGSWPKPFSLVHRWRRGGWLRPFSLLDWWRRSSFAKRILVAGYLGLVGVAVLGVMLIRPCVLLMPVAMLILVAAMLLALARFRSIVRSAGPAAPTAYLWRVVRALVAVMAIATVLGASLSLPFVVAWGLDLEEPLDPWQGVSVLPTASVRFLVSAIAVMALVVYWRAVCTDLDAIAERFSLTDPPADARGSPWLMTWQREDGNRDMAGLWKNFRLRVRWTAVWQRVVPLAALWLLGLALVFALDVPVAPARGTGTFAIDAIGVVLLVATTLTLNLVIWDQIRACNRFIELLPRGASKYGAAVERASGLHPDLAPSLLDLRLISALTATPRRMVYVPVALLVLAMLSRSPIVDNWVMTTPLFIATSLSVGVAMHGAFLLRSTARRAREMEVNRLETMAVLRTDQAASQPGSLPTAKERDEALGTLRQFSEGVFAGPFKDPAFRAVLIPLVPILTALAVDFIAQLQ